MQWAVIIPHKKLLMGLFTIIKKIVIDLDKIRENLKNPTLIDNANIEQNSEKK